LRSIGAVEFDGDLFDSSAHELIADEDKSEWKKMKVDFRSHNLGLGARWGTSPSVHKLWKWGGNFDRVGERQD
jgi:hypothetical protein